MSQKYSIRLNLFKANLQFTTGKSVWQEQPTQCNSDNINEFCKIIYQETEMISFVVNN